MRTWATACAGFAIVTAALLQPSGSAKAMPCEREFGSSHGSSCHRQLDWHYDQSREAFIREGGTQRDDSAASSGVRYAWRRLERCGPTGASCPAAASTCLHGATRGYRYLLYGYIADSGGLPRSNVPDIITTECVWPETVVPAAVVEAAVAQDIRKRVGRPSITTAPPGGRTLVNIPTVYSTQRFDQVSLAVKAPVPGAITAVPEWVWRFPDGSTGLGPGTPYEASVDPLVDPDHYVHTVYRSVGSQRVSMTLTWRVTFRLEDVLDVDLAPIRFTRTATTTALAAKNQLEDAPH